MFCSLSRKHKDIKVIQCFFSLNFLVCIIYSPLFWILGGKKHPKKKKNPSVKPIFDHCCVVLMCHLFCSVADVDECATGIAVCPRFRKCINTFGSYICKCHEGFDLQYINGKYQCIGTVTGFCTGIQAAGGVGGGHSCDVFDLSQFLSPETLIMKKKTNNFL